MIRGLWSSATGMQAQQLQLDTIANNLANVTTVGFKKSRVEFEDLFIKTSSLLELSLQRSADSSWNAGRAWG